jgi:hypothetical protein
VASGVGKGIKKLIAGLVKLCVYAVIFGLIGLVVWPVSPNGKVGTAEEGERIGDALEYVEAAQKAGRPAQLPLSEAQLNAYFKQQVSEISSSGGGLQVENINVDIDAHNLVFFTGTALGPVKLTWEMALVPNGTQGKFPFDVVKARWGHFPMLGGLKQFAAGKVASLFKDFDSEKELLEKVHQVKLSEGGLILSVSK